MIFNLGGGAAAPQLTNIAVTTKPTTTTYDEGASFNKSGMVVTAYFDDGSNAEVTAYSYSPTTIPGGSSSITISYTHEEVTKTTTVAVVGRRWLYKPGNECTSATGGWVGDDRPSSSSISGKLPTIGKYSTHILLDFNSSTSYASGQLITNSDINLSNFSTLTAVFQRVYIKGSYSSIGVGVGSRSATTLSNSAYKTVVSHNNYSQPALVTERTNVTATVDVSAVNTSLAVYVSAARSSAQGAVGAVELELTQMYLT